MNVAVRETDVRGLLSPRSVAVIGASEDLTKFGGRIFKLLVQHGYAGTIYPINPKRETLLGIKAYPSIDATPTPPDMAVMAVPRDSVKAAVAACAAAGTKATIVITAKFSDAGDEGAALEREIVEVANAGGMRIIGPNCLGIISPANDLVLCASPALYVDRLIKGKIGMVSQSGALMATIFDRAMTHGIGFSHCFSIGNQADLELCDFIDFLIADKQTDIICSYIEGVKRPDRFLESAEKARRAGKPWLAVKAGRTALGAAAAFSHTASLAGSYEAFEAACREAGILTMDDTDAMILLAAALERYPHARPEKLGIVTTSGGGGAITADRLADAGLSMATFAPETVKELEALYPPKAAASNPIDMGAAIQGGSMVVGSGSIKALLTDPGVDAVLSPLTTCPDIRLLCEMLSDGMKEARESGSDKPHIVVLQPGQAADPGRAELRKQNVLYTDSLDEAIRALSAWQRFTALKPRQALERPKGIPREPLAEERRGALGEGETKELLARYGVTVNKGEVVADANAAKRVAAELTAPYVVKVVSPDIIHKSDVGGVVLGLETPEAVQEAVAAMGGRIAASHPKARIEGYLVQEMRAGKAELFIGARRDPQFGPLIIVGAGGVLVELLKDVAVARAPVAREEAVELLDRLLISRLLKGFRGSAPLDIEAAADMVARVSWLVSDLGERFEELDVNPLLVGEAGKGCVAVDGRLLLK